MSKRAEEAALKKYPPKRKEVSMTGAIYTVVGGDFERRIFKEGYEQAEKDLALTWEDIEKITDIHRNVLYDNPKRIMGAKENYEDTLREFNEWREKK